MQQTMIGNGGAATLFVEVFANVPGNPSNEGSG
jgi:hypothetical protein